MSRVDFNGVTEQRKAAFKRLRDAEALLAHEESENWRQAKGEHARGAMYLAGYAIECKMKAIAMEVHRCRTLSQLAAKLGVDDRDVYTHGLEALATRLPLYANLKRSPVWRDFAGHVNAWRPSWRYDPNDWINESASAFLLAVRRVYNWLESNRC